MRLLLLGDPSPVMDEGAKNVAASLTRYLAKKHAVLQLHQREVFRPALLWKALRHRPQVVMSVQGPSAKTIALLFLLRLLCGWPTTIAIGAQPSTSPSLLRALRWLAPTRVFAQSTRWIQRFESAGASVRRLPNGVNTDKFDPACPPDALTALRAELGLTGNRRVALHIGPLNRNRNFELLIRLQLETDWQVLVVGSTTAPFVPEVAQALADAGVCVARRYFPDINLVYGLADVYVFPVVDEGGSIEFPLTVLEAMACNRPVASTRFLALPEYLQEGPAFRYFNGFDELRVALSIVAGQNGNRQRAEEYDWNRIVERIEAEFSPSLAGVH
jgi:glycosyltransferase involved in cell wall biosynthesis